MMTRRVGTDTERVGDFRVRLALGEQLGDLGLSTRQLEPFLQFVR
jgi:hypothetical protein